MALDSWVGIDLPFFGIDRAESPVRFTRPLPPPPERPVYAMTVRRFADGRTEVTRAVIADADMGGTFPMPESWELRHRMLVDALAEVKRQACVEHRDGKPEDAR